MAKAVKTVAGVVAAVAGVALIATGVGMPLGLGLTATVLSTIGTAPSRVSRLGLHRP